LSETSAVTWLEAVRQVVSAVQSSDVTELELARGDFSVRVRRSPAATRPPEDGRSHDQSDHGLHTVAAPFTGVFYRSPTPAARAYVNEGDWVDADAVIGLVETMKIFNEVTADMAGRIVRFAAENGQLVHAGDALVVLEPGERATADSEPHL
jgi:acetyl-CoA carboxylase biotin carboxyl carrier protein